MAFLSGWPFLISFSGANSGNSDCHCDRLSLRVCSFWSRFDQARRIWRHPLYRIRKYRATNVLRTGNKKLAIATLLLDGAKGAFAVFFISLVYSCETNMCVSAHALAPFVAGFFALIGHIFPVWLKFKGGKGVATGLGVLLALSWQVGLAVAATWLLVALLFRISSLAALCAIALSPLYAFLISGDENLVAFCIAVGLLIIAKHHTNIRRLIKGEEPKIGKKKDA